jgi:radical SAM superfamily enzyme YgiQ (UPF0313 family)
VAWFCFARVDGITKEILAAMKRAGCFSIGFGVETGDAEIMKSIKKGITLDQVRQALRWSREAGIKSQCFFVFGNPGETPGTAERTIRFAMELKPALAFFNMMVPYPGTEAYRAHFGDVGRPPDRVRWEDWVAVGLRSTIHVPGIKSLEELVARANARFYFRPSQILRMLRHVSNATELLQLIRGGLALCLQIIRWRLSGARRVG